MENSREHPSEEKIKKKSYTAPQLSIHGYVSSLTGNMMKGFPFDMMGKLMKTPVSS